MRRRMSADSAPVSQRPWTNTAAGFINFTDGVASTPFSDVGAQRLSSGGRRAYPDMQLAELLFRYFRGSVGHHVRRGLRLRERDHVADALGATHVHDQPVESERDAAV